MENVISINSIQEDESVVRILEYASATDAIAVLRPVGLSSPVSTINFHAQDANGRMLNLIIWADGDITFEIV